jgi:hypothetical protein
MSTGHHVGNLEPPLLVGHRRLPRFLQPHGHFADARAIAGVDDGPANRSGPLGLGERRRSETEQDR